MNPKVKLLAAHLCSVVTGVVLVGAFGALTFFDSAYASESKTDPAADTVQYGNDEKAESAEEKAAQTTAATEVVGFVNFKKAPISAYEMTEVQNGGESENDNSKAKIVEVDDFAVAVSDGELKYYDYCPEPLNFTETRSVADEYYTVNDIISGTRLTLDAHELLCRMVYSEIGDSWGEEAIKAQTVAAYSYLRFNDRIGLTPTVGLKSGYSAKIEKCVNAVEGQAVYYKGSIINAVYSASTAGYSTTAKDVWGVNYPYLQCVKSEYDHLDPNWGLETTYTTEEVRDIIESETDIKLSDDVTKWFEVTDSYCGKHISKVSIDGHSSCSLGTITGSTLCQLFSVKTNAMDITYKDGKFTFTSYGWGHGVGMSQWGACLYARNGWTYDQILRHYYINTTLGLSDVNQKAVEREYAPPEKIQIQAEEGATSASADITAEEKASVPVQAEITVTTAVTEAPVKENADANAAEGETDKESDKTAASTTTAVTTVTKPEEAPDAEADKTPAVTTAPESDEPTVEKEELNITENI